MPSSTALLYKTSVKIQQVQVSMIRAFKKLADVGTTSRYIVAEKDTSLTTLAGI